MKPLDEEQVRKLKSFNVNLVKQVLPLKAELQVKQLWDAEMLYEEGILSKSDEAFAAENQIHPATTRYYLEVAKPLKKNREPKIIGTLISKNRLLAKEAS